MPLGTTGVADAVLEPRPRIGFVSLGCPKNLVDSEVMMGLLDQAGAEITNRPETADILVVNTCSFIDKAKQESIDTILQMAQHKLSGKARKLIVAGDSATLGKAARSMSAMRSRTSAALTPSRRARL